MDIFDIIGPVMVGPSSSHTAGAVRIGYISQKLMGEQIKEANILLYGSFLDTGKGHMLIIDYCTLKIFTE